MPPPTIESLTIDRMGLLALFRKKQQDPAATEGAFSSRAEEASNAVRSRARRKSAEPPPTEPIDPVLPEKKRARRRLIGAIALVLAAVIGLPLVLDSEPKPLGDDVEIQIPSKDKASGGNNLPIPLPRTAALDKAEEVVDVPPPASQPVSDAPMVKKPMPNAEAEPTQLHSAPRIVAPPVKPVSVPADVSEVKPMMRPEPKQEARATQKATDTTDPKSKSRLEKDTSDGARARALLDGDGGLVPTDKKPVKVVLQVAALASRDKVSDLQQRLKAAGLRSFTQTVATETGEKIRVRVGPFSSKEEADKARSKLDKLGLAGKLVTN